MEGFMAVMTVIITSSLFILLAEIAPAFGFK
jgi:cellobiose-specific phosphotransferase system component IIC